MTKGSAESSSKTHVSCRTNTKPHNGYRLIERSLQLHNRPEVSNSTPEMAILKKLNKYVGQRTFTFEYGKKSTAKYSHLRENSKKVHVIM